MSPAPDNPNSTPPRKKLHNGPPFSDITPLRPRITSLRQAYGPKRVQAIVKPLLRKDFMGNLQKHADVYEFVESVWGLKRATLDWQRWGSQFVRPDKLHTEFIKSSAEPLMYKPLCAILEDADEQARTALNIVVPPAIKLLPMGSTRLINEETVRSPDWAVSSTESPHPDSDKKKAHASTVGFPMCNENKVKSGLGDKARPDVAPSSKSRKARKTAANPTSKRSARADVQDGVFADDSTASIGMKRKVKSESLGPRKALKSSEYRLDAISETCAADAGLIYDAFGPDAPNLTHDQTQLASYALECMSDIGNRRYTTGIFMRGQHMSLWYFDRIGAIKSEEFDIQSKDNQEKLVLVAHALHSCDRNHFGYEPLLKEPTPSVAPTTVDNATLTLPGREVADCDGKPVAGDISFTVKGDALHVQYGIVGRGTVVLRIEPRDVEGFSKKNQDLVAKLSWPVATRPAEDTLLRTIRAKVPKRWRRHLPELHFSATLDADALSLPRKHMTLKGFPELRVLRILVSNHAFHLSQIRTLHDFKKVFIDLVDCHYYVYKKADVLHRDLSVNNLMFIRTLKYGITGILNDWDLSETISKGSNSRAGATARHRTGTAPFMALELLADKPPRHLYRHDLESFIYILVWCAVQFNLDGTQETELSPVLHQWARGSWQAIEEHKFHVLCAPITPKRELIYDAVKPRFKPLLETWIKPLMKLLGDAHLARNAHVNAAKSATPVQAAAETTAETDDPYDGSGVGVVALEDDEDDDDDGTDEDDDDEEEEEADESDHVLPSSKEKPWDEETLGGRITYKKIMKILRRKT